MLQNATSNGNGYENDNINNHVDRNGHGYLMKNKKRNTLNESGTK